jgi:hypothetical protein
MNRPDEEFDDFLTRRKPLFRRAPEDVLEPPEEVDRLVLRQAREAIATERPQRLYQGTWGASLAIAATLLLVFGVVLHATLPKKAGVPEVTVQQVSQPGEYPATAAKTPAYRQDARAWLAEIDRLRAAGKNAEADAEMTAYKQQHRAYAGSPDR